MGLLSQVIAYKQTVKVPIGGLATVPAEENSPRLCDGWLPEAHHR